MFRAILSNKVINSSSKVNIFNKARIEIMKIKVRNQTAFRKNKEMVLIIIQAAKILAIVFINTLFQPILLNDILAIDNRIKKRIGKQKSCR